MASARGSTRVGVRTREPTPVVEAIVPNSGWTQDSAGHYLVVDLPEFRKEDVKLQVDSYGRIVVTGDRHVDEWKRVHFRLTFPEPLDSDVNKIAGKFDGGILYVTVPKQLIRQNKESETAKNGDGEIERAKGNDSHQHRNGAVERAGKKDSHQHGNGEIERAGENHSYATNVDEGRGGLSQHENHTEQEVKRNENEHIREFPEQVIRKWDQESILRGAVDVLRKNKGIVITAVIAFSLGLFVSRKFNSTIS